MTQGAGRGNATDPCLLRGWAAVTHSSLLAASQLPAFLHVKLIIPLKGQTPLHNPLWLLPNPFSGPSPQPHRLSLIPFIRHLSCPAPPTSVTGSFSLRNYNALSRPLMSLVGPSSFKIQLSGSLSWEAFLAHLLTPPSPKQSHPPARIAIEHLYFLFF